MEKRDWHFFEHITEWIGSISSLIAHSVIFIFFFGLSFFGFISWSLMLLVLTTIVSLEAIYLAIFIQMTVNRHSDELEEVSEDVDEIQEDIDEIQEDVGEIQGDIDEMQEDVEELSEGEQEDEARKKVQLVTLEQLTRDIQRVLKDLEAFKKQ